MLGELAGRLGRAPAVRALRPAVERGGDLLTGLLGREGQVPRPLLRVGRALRQLAVQLPPPSAGGPLVHGAGE
jgi:hypothetical protein